MAILKHLSKALAVVFCAALAACSSKPILKEILKPKTNRFISAVSVPEKFEPDPYVTMAITVTVKGKKGIKPEDSAALRLYVADAAGKKREVRFSRALGVAQLAAGVAWTTFNPVKAKLEPGSYKVCANVEGLDAPDVCGAFVLFAPKFDPCYLKFVEIQDEVKCECVKGDIRRAGTAHPPLDGVSPIIGGPTLGPYDHFVPPDKLTSVFKFEAHFKIRVTDSLMPNECSLEHWKKLAAAKCTEGQEVNQTRFGKGATGGTRKKYPVGDPASEPFDPRPDAKRSWDNYNEPGTFMEKFAAHPGAQSKSHDGDVIHWFDGPGYVEGDFGYLLDMRPTERMDYFHSWVHGSSGNPNDNCDCFFKVRNSVVKVNGSLGISALGPVTGNKCK